MIFYGMFIIFRQFQRNTGEQILRSHLCELLIDGREGLTPHRLLQQNTQVCVGEPAAPQSLPLRNAAHPRRNVTTGRQDTPIDSTADPQTSHAAFFRVV